MPQQIDYAALAKQFGGQAAGPEPPPATAPPAPEGDAMLQNIKNIGGFVTEHLPVAGGILGGALGGPPGAMLGGAAGEAYKQLINRARGIETRGPAQAAAGIAGQTAAQGAAQGAGEAIGQGMAKVAPWLMETAVKPTKAVVQEYRTSAPAIVKTLLDEGITVSKNGIAKLQSLVDATNQEIREILVNRDQIRKALGFGPAVEPHMVASRGASTATKMLDQVNPQTDLEAAGRTVKNFLDHPKYQGQPMSLTEAQDMKVGTYQRIGKKYGQLSSAEVETEKALARGLKEEIAKETPAISKLNEKDSQLLAALDAVGQRVAVAGRRDPIGFAWVTQNPVTFLAALADRSPVVKSMLAKGLYKQAAQASNVSPQLIRAALIAIANSEEE